MERVEAVTDFIFLGSKIYADFDCSYIIKDNWIWKCSYDNLRHLIKIHWYHFANKGLFCQQYGCCFSSYEWIWEVHHKESWDQRTNALELWCWRRLLRVRRMARRSNQSIVKEISPEYSLEGLMLKLKSQYVGYLMRRTISLEKTLMLGKFEGRRRREWQRIRWSDGIIDSKAMNLTKLWKMVEDRGTWCGTVHRVVESQTCHSN